MGRDEWGTNVPPVGPHVGTCGIIYGPPTLKEVQSIFMGRVTTGHGDHFPPVSRSVQLFIGGSSELKFFGDVVRRITPNYCPQSLESTGNE